MQNCRSAVRTGLDPFGVLHRALEAVSDGPRPDLLLLFASSAFAEQFQPMLEEARARTGAGILAGCSGQAVVGDGHEVEGEPAVSVLALTLPGAWLRGVHLTQEDVEVATTPEAWRARTGVPANDARGWVLFVDPFTTDAEALVACFEAAYPGVTVVGGMASGNPRSRRTHLFLDGAVSSDGTVALAVGGAYSIAAVVSQGAEPIGQAWTITGAHQNHIETIGNRPAYAVLAETVRALGPEQRERARSNLLVGLAIDERRDEFSRGDFLIRNLMGYDQESGSLAVGAFPRVGQTVQFQIRDAGAAHDELREMLTAARADFGGRSPEAALICTCNGRGEGLFGQKDHDAGLVESILGPVPNAGFFCNGEIGPVGSKVFLHGFTATIGLLVRDPAPAAQGGSGPEKAG